MNTDPILRRIWRGLPAFTDGKHTVHPSDLEFPVTERR